MDYDKQKQKFILLNKLNTIIKEFKHKEYIMRNLAKHIIYFEITIATKLIATENDVIILKNIINKYVKLSEDMENIKKELSSLLWSEHELRMKIAEI